MRMFRVLSVDAFSNSQMSVVFNKIKMIEIIEMINKSNVVIVIVFCCYFCY